MSAFPLLKVGTLAVKTLAKPLANVLKEQAKDHPELRRICVNIGQFVNEKSVKVNMRFLGHKITEVKPLNESAAVSKGADILGEGFIYSVSVATVLVEVYRREKENQVKSARTKAEERVKDERLAQSLQKLNERIDELHRQSQKLDLQISGLQAQLDSQSQGSKESDSIFSRLLKLY
mmetsp:Transcript_1284/g.1961  ORF Transcript_1284/g.1961 Transcript_1284/m.1961 type:complete len:177 (-) Transcript_1284:699-1229(-)|eukprot:CAMPEP_0204824384 /NCGR_PEP_ID=MMETSP1346-20131115/2404_1 /ASSEMBLY_ACC=CAM_ASM_000771 /TAXON_ID=215587 /ORGANISM="Aplanochytrium stocchinoi, Strain GSBS06" /LENGTH=176 /DNA_ID=CAMNT_0051951505 /DNA_START=259 /DNA_END=789 /DNA_ORIENTATION=-